MKLRVFLLTYKRLDYTRLSLRRLCETVPDYGRITVWDNNSGPEMRALLAQFEGHPRIERIIYHPTNDRLRGPTNRFWSEFVGDAEYLSKVDDDCLVSPGWCDTLIQAHEEIPEAGVLGCWRYLDEDFVPELANRKIQKFGRHQLMRNCWVEGSGYIMKRAVLDRIGGLQDEESFTGWCIRAADAGYVNGWYYPFLFQEHMDDPRVPHSGMKTEEDFQRLRPLSAGTFNLKTRQDWIDWLHLDARNQQQRSFNPRHYLGWWPKVRRRIGRILGRDLTPTV